MIKGISLIPWRGSVNKATTGGNFMQTPGEILKEARLASGRALEDLSAVTRIPIDTLEGLENDNYDDISADVFVKGFLRNYSRELKVSEESVIEAFYELRGESLPVASTTAEISDVVGVGQVKVGATRRPIRRSFKLSYVLIILVVALSLLLSVLFLGLDSNDDSDVTRHDGSSPSAIRTDTPESRWNLHDDDPAPHNPTNEPSTQQ